MYKKKELVSLCVKFFHSFSGTSNSTERAHHIADTLKDETDIPNPDEANLDGLDDQDAFKSVVEPSDVM